VLQEVAAIHGGSAQTMRVPAAWFDLDTISTTAIDARRWSGTSEEGARPGLQDWQLDWIERMDWLSNEHTRMSPYFVISISIPPFRLTNRAIYYGIIPRSNSRRHRMTAAKTQWPGLKPIRGAEQSNTSITTCHKIPSPIYRPWLQHENTCIFIKDGCISTLGSSDRLVQLRGDTPLSLIPLY
jgi:hypothetical protein